MEALRTTPGEMRADTDRKPHPAKAGLLAGRCVETAHFRQHKAHAWAGLLLSLVAGAGLNGWAQTVGGPKIPLSDLADMSLEDLTKMEVTSVSKHKEKLADAPAAIFVITQDDIHRSGVTTIAEALRLAPGLEVRRGDGPDGAITCRGFSSVLSDKRHVGDHCPSGSYPPV